MPERFEIAADSTPGHRAFFETVNRMLDRLGATADQLDHAFRIDLMRQCEEIGNSAAVAAYQSMDASVRDQMLRSDAMMQTSLATLNRRSQGVLGGNRISVSFRRTIDRGRFIAVLGAMHQPPTSVVSAAAEQIGQMIGRFQDIDRAAVTGGQEAVVDAFSNAVAGPLRPAAPSGNLLQRFAGGQRLFAHGTAPLLWDKAADVAFHGAHPGAYVLSALTRALDELGRARGWDEARRRAELGVGIQEMERSAERMAGPESQTREGGQAHFELAANASPELTGMFTAINGALDATGVSPEEFDHHFRIALMQQVTLLGNSTTTELMEKMPAAMRGQVERGMPPSEQARMDERRAEIDAAFYRGGKLAVSIKGDNWPAWAQQSIQIENQVTADMTTEINRHLGRFQDVSPNPLSHREQRTYNRAVQAMGVGSVLGPQPGAESSNLAQAIAMGKLALFGQREPKRWGKSGLTFTSQPPGNYVVRALAHAISLAAASHGWQPERQQAELAGFIDQVHAGGRRLSPLSKAAPPPPPPPSPIDPEAVERRRIEALRQAEEALLQHSPYGMSVRLLGMHTRATRNGPPPPEKELHDAVAQAMRLTESLNKNFAAHQRSGDALFASHDAATLRALDHIATGRPLPELTPEARAQTRDELVRLVSEPLETLAQPLRTPGVRERLIEANRETHAASVRHLLAAPLLAIAALGTPEMISEAREVQKVLFPANKKHALPPDEAAQWQQELRGIAAGAWEHAFAQAGIAMPEGLRDTVAGAPPVPPPPGVGAGAGGGEAPPPAEPAPPISDAALRDWAESFVTEMLQARPPYTMFRSSLGMEPGHSIRLTLSRWVEDGEGHRRVDSRQTERKLNEPNLARALELKKELQSYILQHMPLAEHRRLHEGHFAAGEDAILPRIAPQPDPNQPHEDGRPGRIIPADGVYSLRLVFPPGAGGPQEGERTEMTMSLGVRQEGDAAEANRRRLRVLEQLDLARAQGRDLTAQDLRLWLQTDVQRRQGGWEHAATIDLRNYPVQRVLKVAFPDSQHDEHTTLHIENPTLEGTPNLSWSVPVSIRVNGREIANTRVNTHIRDEAQLPEKIAELSQHIRIGLEEYARAYPDARWQLGENNRLAQLDEVQLRRNSNMDWTRIDRLKNDLGYAHRLSVRTGEAQDIGVAGKKGFTLTVQRADGSAFNESRPGARLPVPVQRSYTIDEGETPADTARAIETFRERLQNEFQPLVREAYSGRQDEELGRADTPQRRKGLQHFDSRSIVQMFDAARRSVRSAAAGISEAAAPARGGAGGPMQPGDAVQRHRLQDGDGPFSARLGRRGFGLIR